MFTSSNNGLIERYLEREEEEVGPDRCIQLKTKKKIDRDIVR